MQALLLIGPETDPFIDALRRRPCGRSQRLIHLDEGELYTTEFELHRSGRSVAGTIHAKDGPLDFREIRSVVFRPQRAWWPDQDFQFSDAVFVYHETVAAWIAVLKSLAARVVNDFGLGWWLGDPMYGEMLKRDLAQALQLPNRSPTSVTDEPRTPSVQRPSGEPASFLVGGRAVVALGSGTATDRRRVLEERLQDGRLAAWQERMRHHLVRLDFALDGNGDPSTLLAVDPLPDAPEDEIAMGRLSEGLSHALHWGEDP
jgi:hypothetical protein